MTTREDYGNAYVCEDCYIAHHYGYREVDREPTDDELHAWHGGYPRNTTLSGATFFGILKPTFRARGATKVEIFCASGACLRIAARSLSAPIRPHAILTLHKPPPHPLRSLST